MTAHNPLNFDTFRSVNLARCLRWHPDGIASWSKSDWAVAIAGEAGEMCNVVKKLNRLRDGLAGNHGEDVSHAKLIAKLGQELADVVIYCDLLAQREGLNLGELVRSKFNEVSERNNFPERL